jgi:signal transduction histidine kinase
VHTILVQEQIHTDLLGKTSAQEARVETERNMTAYFAHELRNPLGAIDSALVAMPDELPKPAKDLLKGMELCSTFMSSIMNNLLDVQRMEEGKMTFIKAHWR